MNLKSNLQKVLALLIALVLVAPFSILAQDGENLVENGSFEQANTKKLRSSGGIENADGWFSPTGNKADLFASDAKMDDVQTPANMYGTEEPKEGFNYAGIIAYSYREKENRTYITTELTTSLKKGMRYQVQFYASLSELSKYASNKIGVHFSKKVPGTSQKVPAMIMDTHIQHPKEEVFTGMYGWDLVCGEYVATGKEKFLTIGNFTNEQDVVVDRVRKPRDVRGTQIIAAYYYIDDVSVKLLGPDEKCNCNYPDEAVTKTLTLYQRAPEISLNMSPSDKIKEYSIYYASGRYDLRTDGNTAIDNIIEILKENPSLNIQIIGHADESEAMNASSQDISSKRANYIQSILVEEGIAANRIDVKDDKDRSPSKYISGDDTEELKHAKNRRVTFKTY